MASSSTHDTGLELVLRSLWCTCNLRLRASNRHDDADQITENFAETLDVAFDELISGPWPPGRAGRHPEAVAYETQVIGIVWSEGARLKRSDKVAQAACALTEAWEELEKVGRAEEGKWFKEAGIELHNIAVQVVEIEQERARRKEGRTRKRQARERRERLSQLM